MREGMQKGLQAVLSRPRLVVAIGVLVLFLIVILQNLEPVTLDFLFWSLGPFSKLFLILGAMLVGGLTWEAIRFLLRR